MGLSRIVGIGCAAGLTVASGLLWAGLIPAPLPAVHAAHSPAMRTERLEDVRSTILTANGQRMHLTARTIESPPVRVFGPIRLGFARSAIASDVHVDFDARDPASNASAPAAAYASGLSARALGLSQGNLVGLQVDGFSARVVDPIGRVLTVRARRCEMESASSLMCSNGSLNFGTQDAAFSRARFDGTSWQIVEVPSGPSTSRPYGKTAAGAASFAAERAGPQCALAR